MYFRLPTNLGSGDIEDLAFVAVSLLHKASLYWEDLAIASNKN